jgi:hypothetical protein
MRVRLWFLTVLAVVLPAIVAIAALPWRARVPSADVAALLVGVVTLAGTMGLRATPIMAAFSAGATFVVFWTEPYGALQVRDPGDRLTGVVLLVVGAVLAEFCRARRQRLVRHRRTRFRWTADGTTQLQTVSRVAADIAGGDDAGLVVLDVARGLVELLDLKDCSFELSRSESPSRPELVPPGEMVLRGTRWDPAPIGLPLNGFDIPVVARGRVEGTFVCVPRRSRRVSRESLDIAITLADQAAFALLLDSVG